MMLAERLDQDAQDSTELCAMAPQCLDKLVRWLGRAQNRVEEGISVRANEHHPRMLVQNPAGTFVSEIASRQPRDGHRALDELLGGWGNPQLKTFLLQLTVGRSWTC
jgi:hypothetical protein